MRRRRREQGQAMPMAAVGLLIMALGVMATLNIGQAVYEKIKLQNAADSAAYTLAAMKARTFNYIAFLNRAQIAHYNTAMVVQSYLVWVGAHVAAFGTAVNLLETMADQATVGVESTTPCPKGIQCFYLGLRGTLQVGLDTNQPLLKQAITRYKEADKLAHELVEAIGIFNWQAIYQAQFARAALLNVHILTGMQNYIEKIDPQVSFANGKSALLNVVVNMAMNSIEYYQTFDAGAGLNPYVYGIARDFRRVFPRQSAEYASLSHDDASREAYGVMAELVHATRTPKLVFDRGENLIVGIPLLPMGAVTVEGYMVGQTKFTRKVNVNSAQIAQIGQPSHYPDGHAISSDSFLIGAGSGYAAMVSASARVEYTPIWGQVGDAVAAYKEKGKHLHYSGGESDPQVLSKPPSYQARNPKGPGYDTDSRAAWPGMAPYFKFNAKGDRSADYNQPSTWIFLNKHHKDFQSDGGSHGQGGSSPWFSDFEWRHGNQQPVKLNTAIGGDRNSYLFEGVNVVSRGMAYYHRPGNWTEHPNFFNPFWRARLAPVGEKLQKFWDRWVTGSITTSSEDQVVRGMVNLLRNAQMDLFTAAITSLCTH